MNIRNINIITNSFHNPNQSTFADYKYQPFIPGFFSAIGSSMGFSIQTPSESRQVIVSPGFNLLDPLPTMDGEPFVLTFYDPPPQLDMATLSFKSIGKI